MIWIRAGSGAAGGQARSASGGRSVRDVLGGPASVDARSVRLHLKVERIDSLDVRPLFPETGFSMAEVNRHVKRSGHLCAMLEKNGVIVVASFVSPYAESRQFARSVAKNFVEVYMKTTVEACEQRDSKGHYARARSGEYKDFPGVDAPYDVPDNPEITIEIDLTTMDDAVDQIMNYLRKNILNN